MDKHKNRSSTFVFRIQIFRERRNILFVSVRFYAAVGKMAEKSDSSNDTSSGKFTLLYTFFYILLYYFRRDIPIRHQWIQHFQFQLQFQRWISVSVCEFSRKLCSTRIPDLHDSSSLAQDPVRGQHQQKQRFYWRTWLGGYSFWSRKDCFDRIRKTSSTVWSEWVWEQAKSTTTFLDWECRLSLHRSHDRFWSREIHHEATKFSALPQMGCQGK